MEELRALLPRAAVPAGAWVLKGGIEIVGSQRVRREIQSLRFCFNLVTLRY